MPASTSIHPVSPSDLPTLGDFLYSCKLTLTINKLLFKEWPNEATQKPIYTGAVERANKDPEVEDLKVVDEKSGEIVAYLALTRKRPAAKTEQPPAEDNGEGKKQDAPDFFNPDVLSLVGATSAEIAKEMEGIDHFEITYICVKPAYRRQGLATKLVQIGFNKAKAEGLPLAVCSEPAAYEFFAQLGFRDVKHVDMDLAKLAPAKYSGFGVFRLAGMVWGGS